MAFGTDKEESYPLISIITVVYNNATGIAKTMRSVLEQSYKHIEYIIIDGGSTDGTLEIINQYASGVKKIVSEPDKGIYDAMNKGLKLATGELIGIINSGDFYEPTAVQEVVDVYSKESNYAVYHGILRVFSTDEQLLYIIGNTDNFLPTGMIQHPTCFVKKDVYTTQGLFSLDYRSSSDYEFMLRLRKNNAQFKFIESILANFYEGGISSNAAAMIETLNIRFRYGFISNLKKKFMITFIKARAALNK